MSKQSSAAEEKAKNEALRQELDMLKAKYDEQIALNLTQTQTLADRETLIQERAPKYGKCQSNSSEPLSKSPRSRRNRREYPYIGISRPQ